MKRSVQIWRVALAVLMTLAVILVWPPLGSEAASSTIHAVFPASHSHHTHAGEDDPQRVLHVTLDVDCQASAIGCCVMNHCHPGISVDLHEMTAFASNDETMVAVALRGSGSEPGVITPPPRRLWL
ncbi:hypothetical protein SAMN04488238_11626 [Roseicitreum antarcticum]|jgi:hypothetical protein|uniref:Uncharacterized protein n=1 Tax=Roseicitreum antarcticum TaxID=564137 RepID=A0A1H3DVK1_9RHOB|nr:hypothetical protein SAMN04488238_11626 [Roseicitreum antarcticum]